VYLGGSLAALAVLGVILAIVALATRNQEVAQNPSATPTPSAATTPPTTTPAPTTSAIPTTSPSPSVSPIPTETASPGATTTPFPSPTTAPPTTGSSFPGWTGADGDYTIIIESSKTRSGAEKVAQDAQDSGETVGILNSDDYSSLNGGYYVVFTGTYATKKAAEDALGSVRDNHPDAYVRQIKQ
jgi:septal ring-binding cell division protein DamX